MAEFALTAMQSLTQIPLIGPKIKEGLGGAMEATEATIGSMNRELANTTDAIDVAKERQQQFLDKGQRWSQGLKPWPLDSRRLQTLLQI